MYGTCSIISSCLFLSPILACFSRHQIHPSDSYIERVSCRYYKFLCFEIKWTVSVISSDVSLIEWHVRFTTTPFIPLFDQGFGRYSYLCNRKLSSKKPRECTLVRRVQQGVYGARNLKEYRWTKLSSLLYRWGYRCPNKGLKGTVVNRACLCINGMLCKIMLTVPLILYLYCVVPLILYLYCVVPLTLYLYCVVPLILYLYSVVPLTLYLYCVVPDACDSAWTKNIWYLGEMWRTHQYRTGGNWELVTTKKIKWSV